MLSLFTAGIAADNTTPSLSQRLIELIDITDYDKGVALIEELNREIEKDTPDNRKQLSAEISKYTDVWFSRHHYSEAVKSLRSFQEESKMHLAMVGLGQFTIKENDVVYKVGDKFGHLNPFDQ
jgi:hypothetical protein